MSDQRTVIAMLDGFGQDYADAQPLPTLNAIRDQGGSTLVKAMMPSVTNTNNVSIACGVPPAVHGITGNFYFDPETGTGDYMEDQAFVLAPTVIERARDRGVRSALLTSKEKTVRLLGRGADLAVAAENPPPALTQRYGPPPEIYSAEINHWLWEVAVDLLREEPEIGLLYVHTTDFPMHEWAPQDERSQDHLRSLDALIGEALRTAPDARLLATADHGMNRKRRCWDLGRACAERDAPLRIAISAEKDRYVRHHRTFGGTAYVWLRTPGDRHRVADAIRELDGVEEVLDRAGAAARLRLHPGRIGDLVVLGDADTVFGDLDGGAALELLPDGYRSHGSLHELEVPLYVCGQRGDGAPADGHLDNFDLTRHLYRD
ncbi:MAG: alkaline phosphatase family protein [Candidatus Dormiibacterota bacterium]